MDKKLFICGTGVLLGITFFLTAGMKVASTAENSNSRPGPWVRDHAAGERFTPSRQGRAGNRDPRKGLLDQLGRMARSGEAFDRELFASSIARLMEIDPQATAEFSESLPAGPLREEALRRVSQGWASNDPDMAETWAAGLPDAMERQSVLADVCTRVANANADAAKAIGIAEKHGLDTAEVMDNLAHQWAAQDFPAAAAWIKERPAGERREQMIMRLALVRSATEPAEAARLVVDEIPEGQVQTEAVISVIYQWALRDMAGARGWVALFPESALRTRAENELSNIAAYQTPEPRGD